MLQLKATVVLIILSAIACTTYGAPVESDHDNVAAEVIEKSGLVSSRNRRGIPKGMLSNYNYSYDVTVLQAINTYIYTHIYACI